MALNNVKNFAKVTVLAGHNTTDTSIALQAGQGAILPTGTPYNVVWWNATDFADPADDPNVEVVRVTNIATDTLTVTRAQEGTTATNKNTAGKTYKMIAGFTAKGPEAIGIGLGATSSPSYLVDVRGVASVGQVHITDHDADDGVYIHGLHAGGGAHWTLGAFFNGTNWVAKEATALIVTLDISLGFLFRYDTGLTIGNTYTPTFRGRLDINGNLAALLATAPNVAVDTPGAIATRFFGVTLANGANQNVAIGTSGNIRITGPTGAYNIGGFANGFDGRKLYLFNAVAQTLTINNGDAGSNAANRIQTNTGGNVVLAAASNSWAQFTYDSTLSLWILNDHN